jgi:hypothetical protein
MPVAMEEVGLLPHRTKSKRTRSSNSSRDPNRGDRPTKASPTASNSTPRSTARPSLTNRTNSAPLVPATTDSNLLSVEDDFDAYSHRESVVSIKDDPFFRNYQSPHSVSLSRELRSATYLDRMRTANAANDPSSQSEFSPSEEPSVNLPVCLLISM